MTVARLNLALAEETMFPPRAPFLRNNRGNLPVPPFCAPPPQAHRAVAR
jgi:hypothetical protein